MSLYCASAGEDWGEGDWWWYEPNDEAPLDTKRSRKCCSCKTKIKVGDTARRVLRARPPTEWEEIRGIAGDEVYLASWYLCETCGDLADSLTELGFCFELGGTQSLAQQIKEYRDEEESFAMRIKK